MDSFTNFSLVAFCTKKKTIKLSIITSKISNRYLFFFKTSKILSIAESSLI